MSDLNPNLTQKISETITHAFKKTKVFEKIGKLEIYIGSFIVVSSIISLTSIYMNYCNMDKLKRLQEQIEGSENVVKHNIEINRLQNSLCNHNIVKYLKDITSISIATQEKVIKKIMEINILIQNSKKEVISQGTSMSLLSQVKSIDSIDGWNDNNDMENTREEENIMEKEDDELLNECYDSIPLNNLKKNTSSWFI